MRLKLLILEGSQVKDCLCLVERRDIAGPDGERKFWLVRTEINTFVSDLPPAEFLILGPGGKIGRLEIMEEDKIINSSVVQIILDLTGRAPDIDSFTWPTVLYFAKGIVTKLVN